MASRRLLVVDHVLAEYAGEVIVAPSIDPRNDARAEPFPVELRRPDGSRLEAMAIVRLPLFPDEPPRSLVRLIRVTTKDVPIGTEVWTVA
jgi:hypothetical protein